MVAEVERDAVDRQARQVVVDAYRTACRQSLLERDAFDRALAAYRKRFPNVARDAARHAVAYILTSDGV